MVTFESLDNADFNGSLKHAYCCYLGDGRAKKPKRPEEGNFFEDEKVLLESVGSTLKFLTHDEKLCECYSTGTKNL